MLAHSSHASHLPITQDLSLDVHTKSALQFHLTGKGGKYKPPCKQNKSLFPGGVSPSPSGYCFPTVPVTNPQKDKLPLKNKILHRKLNKLEIINLQ